MNYFNQLDRYQKSFLFLTLILIFFTSYNSEVINVGPLSSVIIFSILIIAYYLLNLILNYISYSYVQISSIIILLYLKESIYSSTPLWIYVTFLLLFFYIIFFLLRKEKIKAIIGLSILIVISFFFFDDKQLVIESDNNTFFIKNGDLSFNYYTYSNGKDKHREEYKNPNFISYDLDASYVMDVDWNQSKLNWRENFWGFDKKNLPLNGRLWVPISDGKFPIISIVHGNHSMQEFSDDGYSYLGELLSKHGYVVNSIDQNFLNGSWDGDFRGNEMSTRAWHFLENLNYLKTLNDDSLSILYNKIDFNKIIIAGHSRGGEAVNIASRYNTLSAFPDNGKLNFDYNFNIIGIVTIAPTDYRYKRNYELENTNYLSIQGSMDSDEESFFGLRQSNRIKNISDSLINVNILVEGANHSQFNSSWGKNDVGFPNKYLINNKYILPDWYQRKILSYYLFNFSEFISKRDMRCRDALINSFDYKISDNESKKIISRYSYSSEFILNNFESDDILLNKEIKISVDSSGKYSLENLVFRGGKSQQNSAFKIESNGRSNIEFILNNKINKFSNLGFDISNTLDSTNFNIILNNKGKKTDTVNLNLFNTNIELKNYKFDYLTKKRFKKINDINFKTYSIDINDNDISSFSFQFNDSSKFYLDNIVLY